MARRDEDELELAERLGRTFRRQLSDLLDRLGDPPDLSRLPAEFWDEVEAELTETIEPLLLRAFQQSVADLVERQGIGVDWGQANLTAAQWARQYTFDLVEGITDTTRQALQQIIGEAFEQSLPLGVVRERIAQYFGPVRAEMIATTEITRAAVEGEIAAAEEINKQMPEQRKLVPVWQTRVDERVCPICQPLNEKRPDRFGADGRPVWVHPDGGIYGPPPAHRRCRCGLGYEPRRIG